MTLTGLVKDGVLRLVLDPANEEPGWTEVALPTGAPPELLRWDGEQVVVDIAAARMALKARVKALRDAAETAGCTVASIGRFDTDPDSQRKISGAVVMAMLAGAAFSMDWRLADESVPTLDAGQMISVGVAVGQHVAACQARKNEIDAALNAAVTITDLEAVAIETGWP